MSHLVWIYLLFGAFLAGRFIEEESRFYGYGITSWLRAPIVFALWPLLILIQIARR